MQILFLGDRNHRIVFARGPRGDEIHIYDSLNSYGHGYSRETNKTICQKAYCFSATLRIINMPVQHQPNNVDCGVFAIPFATDCVFNIKPEAATYKMDVMQTHLKECLTQNKFEPFPKITKRSNRCKSYITHIRMCFAYVVGTLTIVIPKKIKVDLWHALLLVRNDSTKNV